MANYVDMILFAEMPRLFHYRWLLWNCVLVRED